MLISIQNFYSNVLPRAHQGLCCSLCRPGNDGWTLQNITESVGKGSYIVIRKESVDSILDDFRRIAAPSHDGRREERSSLSYHQWRIIVDGWEEEEIGCRIDGLHQFAGLHATEEGYLIHAVIAVSRQTEFCRHRLHLCSCVTIAHEKGMIRQILHLG